MDKLTGLRFTSWCGPKLRLWLWGWLMAGCAAMLPAQRGQLVSAGLTDQLSIQEIRGIYAAFGLPEFLSPILYELDVYQLVYRTPAATGDSLTSASGLVMVPQGVCDFPVYCYNHGTVFYGDDISSQGGDWFLGIPFAANGYLAVLPDYLGLGATPLHLPHTYLHAQTQATAVVDMLRAARQFAQFQGLQTNGQLFMAGYSQGGHVTMAAHRELEAAHAQEFPLTAVAACSGPYDLSGVTAASLLQEAPSSAFNLAYTLFSYQFVYGNLWSQPGDAFAPPYDTLLPAVFNRQQPVFPAGLPDTAVTMLQPAYVAAVQADSLHPVRAALRANDVYRGWQPLSPTRLYYCLSDEVVPFQNALTALQAFQQAQAPSVEGIDLGTGLDHVGCVAPSLIGAKLWFEGFRAACSATGIRPEPAPFALYPNPARDRVWVSAALRRSPGQRLRVQDAQGRTAALLPLPADPAAPVALPALAPGLYFASLDGLAGQVRLVILP